MVAADDKVVIGFMFSGGEKHDAPIGCELLERIGRRKDSIYLLMDRAYEGYETRYTAAMLGYHTVVPPKSNRIDPWDYDKELYKKRNEVERCFRRYKRFRRVCTRYDKLDVMYLAFFTVALIYEAVR